MVRIERVGRGGVDLVEEDSRTHRSLSGEEARREVRNVAEEDRNGSEEAPAEDRNCDAEEVQNNIAGGEDGQAEDRIHSRLLLLRCTLGLDSRTWCLSGETDASDALETDQRRKQSPCTLR